MAPAAPLGGQALADGPDRRRLLFTESLQTRVPRTPRQGLKHQGRWPWLLSTPPSFSFNALAVPSRSLVCPLLYSVPWCPWISPEGWAQNTRGSPEVFPFKRGSLGAESCLQALNLAYIFGALTPETKLHACACFKIHFYLCTSLSELNNTVIVLHRFNRVWLFATPWTTAPQAPLSMGFSKQKYWSGAAKPSSRGSSSSRDQTHVSGIAGGFFTAEPLGKPKQHRNYPHFIPAGTEAWRVKWSPREHE